MVLLSAIAVVVINISRVTSIMLVGKLARCNINIDLNITCVTTKIVTRVSIGVAARLLVLADG